MELVFLALLFVLMVVALTSGFPVAFALPGSAILAIAIAAACGMIFAGNPDAYFAQDGPTQWLSAGVTNFRSLYWVVERDTLIAIPLFVFMGIMLQRSKIAEDLLVAMAQLFGPVPGGLGISVVFVGALLAATTGIVGATVIAMGLISLPAMLRNNYNPSLACGTICASGTLGQIIPPSIVLIILADQLSSAADQANTARQAAYRELTGEYSMPSHFDVVSASAGDMFMGAMIPGLILVGIYMVYILVSALLKPESAPPVPMEGQYDRAFAVKVLLALVPPLTLIFVVLGSILTGIATVNQAGAIGAVGAMVMAGYRLYDGDKGRYAPAILGVVALVVLAVLVNRFELNVKSSTADSLGITLALLAVVALVAAIVWSGWRTYRTDNVLRGVMIETAKTTSMVFIILIGAAMLTSAFRAFGGEELVKHFLTGLPGGFWTQFIVVMVVIFLLGFFLDFIEIAVVVVPIVAPILLADPSANITAVWLGVMVGLNIQTSFLTPPFGFALFYLRGVASKAVKTLQIYKGAVAFIVLQLLGLAIAGMFPSLVNYLPNRTHLTSETAPPPMNPKLQLCLEEYVFSRYAEKEGEILASTARIRDEILPTLPQAPRERLAASLMGAESVFGKVEAVGKAARAREAAEVEYRPIHLEARRVQRELKIHEEALDELNDARRRDEGDEAKVQARIDDRKRLIEAARQHIPADWERAHTQFREVQKAENTARSQYRRQVDEAYEGISVVAKMLADGDRIPALQAAVDGLVDVVRVQAADPAMEAIKQVESQFSEVAELGAVKSALSKARRALKGDAPDRDKSLALIDETLSGLEAEYRWRSAANQSSGAALGAYQMLLADNVGLRQQARLSVDQAKYIAKCKSRHVDISLSF